MMNFAENNQMKESRDLTKGSIIPKLANLTWPMIIGMLGTVAFNLADTYFLGKVGTNELAAIGFTFPVVVFITAIALGMGIGTSSLISRSVKILNKKELSLASSSSLLLTVIPILILLIVGHLTIEPLFAAMGAKPEIIVLIKEYMQIWYWALPFIMIPMVGNNVIRGLGDTLTPGFIMLSSAILNIILDKILIFGLGPIEAMGIKGAAYATFIARFASFIMAITFLHFREKVLSFKFKSFAHLSSYWKNILKIAVPATLSFLVTPVSLGFITKLVSTYGKEAVAAFGIVSRMEMFAMIFVNSLASVLIIFAGQNFSVNNIQRIKSALNKTSFFTLIWGVLLFLTALLFSKEIASAFSIDNKVINITSEYLLIISFSFGLQGIMVLSAAIFNGINKPIPSAIFVMLRMLILYLPLAYLGANLIGLNGIFWAAFTANIIIGVVSFVWISLEIKKQKN